MGKITAERKELMIFGTSCTERRRPSRVILQLTFLLKWNREKAVIRHDIFFRDIKRINAACDLQCTAHI